MSIKANWDSTNGLISYHDSITYETVLPVSPVVFCDDFNGQVINTVQNWTVKDTSAVGNTTPALVEDGANGILTCMLDATDEKQESGLYANNKRHWVLNQGLIFEARITPAVLPTGQAELYFGLAGDYVEGPISEANAGPAEHILFCLDGSGEILIFSDDTVNDKNQITSGVTLTAGTYAICRIDCTTITDVKFYINGNAVATGTTFNMSTVAALKLQPFFMAHKEAATGVGTLYVDFCRVWQKRS